MAYGGYNGYNYSGYGQSYNQNAGVIPPPPPPQQSPFYSQQPLPQQQQQYFSAAPQWRQLPTPYAAAPISPPPPPPRQPWESAPHQAAPVAPAPVSYGGRVAVHVESLDNAILRLQQQAQGGVGLVLAHDTFQVVELAPGSPAEEAGLTIGDYLIAVDQNNVQGMNINTVRELIRGPAGTIVRLRFRETATGRTYIQALVRKGDPRASQQQVSMRSSYSSVPAQNTTVAKPVLTTLRSDKIIPPRSSGYSSSVPRSSLVAPEVLQVREVQPPTPVHVSPAREVLPVKEIPRGQDINSHIFASSSTPRVSTQQYSNQYLPPSSTARTTGEYLSSLPSTSSALVPRSITHPRSTASSIPTPAVRVVKEEFLGWPSDEREVVRDLLVSRQ